LKYLELATTKMALTREPWLLLENLFKIPWGSVFKSGEISHLGDRKNGLANYPKGIRHSKMHFLTVSQPPKSGL
jgi:hypothetical protein